MKKIFYQLAKLFPNNVVLLNRSLNSFKDGLKPREYYKAYIDSKILGEYSWSPEFKTIKELDKFLAYKIDGYKPIYKD